MEQKEQRSSERKKEQQLDETTAKDKEQEEEDSEAKAAMNHEEQAVEMKKQIDAYLDAKAPYPVYLQAIDCPQDRDSRSHRCKYQL